MRDTDRELVKLPATIDAFSALWVPAEVLSWLRPGASA
jgi:hypothetical protein